MILELLQPNIIAFITEHEQDDVNDLLLKYRTIHEVPISLIADQIKGRQKAKEKLPVFYSQKQIIYPPAVNLEQSSSEQTASFKLNFVRGIFGNREAIQGADLSGGFGVDALFLSRLFQEYHFVEPNTQLIKIARHNHQTLSATNIAYENLGADSFLRSFDGKLDLIYVDPSRRTRNNRKVFSFADCEPNILALQQAMFEKAYHILIKASPLLDISLGVQELKFVTKVIVVAVANECKELLFYCDRTSESSLIIEAVNLREKKPESVFRFAAAEEQAAESTFSATKSYVYEPDASVLKAGAFKLIGHRFNLSKLHPNTHLYTSDEIVKDFPGKIFKVLALIKPDPKSALQYFEDGKANVTTRNYPLSADELKRKVRLKDGGTKFLIGYTDIEGKSVAVAERVI